MRSGPATTSLIDALSATENANRRDSVTRWRRWPITPPCATTITRLVGVRGDDALERAPHARVEVVVRFGAGDHVPALLAEDLVEHGVVVDRLRAEDAAFPLAEEHLAQVGLLDRRDAEARRERRRGLVRALQRRHVDRVDRLVLEPVGEQLGLAHAVRVQLGVAVAVAQRERLARDLGGRLAVAHDEHRRRRRAAA